MVTSVIFSESYHLGEFKPFYLHYKFEGLTLYNFVWWCGEIQFWILCHYSDYIS